MSLVNPVAVVIVAFFTVVGAIFHYTLIGLAAGLGAVLLATFLDI